MTRNPTSDPDIAAARAAVPFVLKRGDEAMKGLSHESTTETIHGLVRLETERLVFQWRLARKISVMGGTEMRTDREIEPVKEVSVRLSGIAGAHVRAGAFGWLTGPRLVLSAADLGAFEVVAGPDGLKVDHPAQLYVKIRRRDRLIAEEFCAELALALAERSLPRGLEAAALSQPAPPLDSADPNLTVPEPRSGRGR